MKINIIKNKKIFLLVGIIILIVIPLFILFGKNGLKINDNTIKTSTNFDPKKIIPGTTKEKDIEKALGKPVEKSGNILNYQSNNPNSYNTVQVENGKVAFVKEIITSKIEKTKKDIVSEYGEPKYKLYGPYSNSGINLYIYPDKGLAFLGGDDFDSIQEIWYFPPTTFEDFKRTYAKDYSETLKQYQ